MIDLTSSPEPFVASRFPRQLQSLQSAISSLSLGSDIAQKSPGKSKKCRLLELRKTKDSAELNSASAERKESSFHPSKESDNGVDVRDERKNINVRHDLQSSSTLKDVARKRDQLHPTSDHDDDFEGEAKLTKKESKKKASALHTLKKSKVCEMGIAIDRNYSCSDVGVALKEALLEKSMAFFEATCEVKGLIRWTCRSRENGGSCNVGDEHCRVMHYYVLVMESEEFIDLACTDNDGTFSLLSARVDEAITFMSREHKQSRHQAHTQHTDMSCISPHSSSLQDLSLPLPLPLPHSHTLSIAVVDIEGAVNRKFKSVKMKKTASTVSAHNVSSVVEESEVFLLIEKQISVVKFPKIVDLGEYLAAVSAELLKGLTRAPQADLDYIVKKSLKLPEHLLTATALEQEKYKMQMGWRNMLSSIPSVSQEKAKSLSRTYSCPTALRLSYQNPAISDTDKKLLLQKSFHFVADEYQEFSGIEKMNVKVKLKNSRVEAKLSKKIFHIFTEMDPDFLFDE